MASLPEHIEEYLGTIESGWHLKDETGDIQIVKVSGRPAPGVVTYSTLGMSWATLPMRGDRVVRQELLFSVYERYPATKIASFLITFCKSVLSRGRALLRGEVVGPHQTIIAGVAADSVYSTVPVMFDPRLATFSGSEPPTVFVWLIPIMSSEAKFVKLNGWNKFEDMLENNQPDFWDMDRRTLQLAS